MASLSAAGYSQRGPIGQIWSSTTAAPGGTYYQPLGAGTGNIRDLRRYALPSAGVHLYANNPIETAPTYVFEGVRGYVWGSRW